MLVHSIHSACFSRQHSAYRLAFKKGAAAINSHRGVTGRNIVSLATGPFKQQQERIYNGRKSHGLSSSFLLFLAGGSSIFIYHSQVHPLQCEPTTSAGRPYAEPHTPAIQGPGSSRLAARRNEEPAVESNLDLRSLSFGAVAGISTGVFVKKGLKAVGFLLGGAFVFLQVSVLYFYV